jgi:hypothetical protein
METSTAAGTLSPRSVLAGVVLAVAVLAALLLAATQQAAGASPSSGPSLSQAYAPPGEDCCGRGYP